MKKLLKLAGIVALLLFVYSLFQALFTGLAIGVYLVYGDVTDSIQTDMLDNMETLLNNSQLGGDMIDAMGVGLFLSAVAMLLFIHLTRLYRLHKGIFTSIALKPLLLSTALVFTSIPALNILVQWLPLKNLLENEFAGLSNTLLGAFTISILVPFLEEVMFRGAIGGHMLRNASSPWLAIVLSALIFGIFHMNPVQIVYATLLGMVFGWIYYRTGSLMSVILGHVLNNTLATIMMMHLGPVDETELLRSHISPEISLALEISLFLFFGVLSTCLAVKLHRSLPEPPSPWHESDEPAVDIEECSK